VAASAAVLTAALGMAFARPSAAVAAPSSRPGAASAVGQVDTPFVRTAAMVRTAAGTAGHRGSHTPPPSRASNDAPSEPGGTRTSPDTSGTGANHTTVDPGPAATGSAGGAGAGAAGSGAGGSGAGGPGPGGTSTTEPGTSGSGTNGPGAGDPGSGGAGAGGSGASGSEGGASNPGGGGSGTGGTGSEASENAGPGAGGVNGSSGATAEPEGEAARAGAGTGAGTGGSPDPDASTSTTGSPGVVPADPAPPTGEAATPLRAAGPGLDRTPATGSEPRPAPNQPRQDIGSAGDQGVLTGHDDEDTGIIPASWAAYLPARELGVPIFIAGLIGLIISITGLVTVAIRRRP
jgi:hypothetical protein